MLWDETVVDRGGVGPRDLDLDGDGRAGGGRTLSDRFLGGPGDHLVRTVGTVRVRPGTTDQAISCHARSGGGQARGIYILEM